MSTGHFNGGVPLRPVPTGSPLSIYTFWSAKAKPTDTNAAGVRLDSVSIGPLEGGLFVLRDGSKTIDFLVPEVGQMTVAGNRAYLQTTGLVPVELLPGSLVAVLPWVFSRRDTGEEVTCRFFMGPKVKRQGPSVQLDVSSTWDTETQKLVVRGAKGSTHVIRVADPDVFLTDVTSPSTDKLGQGGRIPFAFEEGSREFIMQVPADLNPLNRVLLSFGRIDLASGLIRTWGEEIHVEEG